MNNGRFSVGHTVNKGKHWKMSDEARKRISEFRKEQWKNGKVNGFKKGNKPIFTKETREKISMGIKKYHDKKGRINHKRYYHSCNSLEYRRWRTKVFERDSFTCQVCKKTGGYLEAHHIKSFAHYPEIRLEISNGVTLCRDCHKLTDNYKYKGRLV